MRLEDIGFYTLSDERVLNSWDNPLQRCELILTDRCNFHCPYCRGIENKYQGTMSYEIAMLILNKWVKDGLVNVRFSGGEPTTYPELLSLVRFCKFNDVKRIAISTNGSASLYDYQQLINAGVNDFSISLDACCAATAENMAGRKGVFQRVLDNIKAISELCYTTVGVVLTNDNVNEIIEVVNLAKSLGVHDIRIITAAQWNTVPEVLKNLPELDYPIYSYRRNNILNGRSVRGIKRDDYHKCPLVIDDIAVVGDYHFPCIIYLREQGDPIGRVDSPMMRTERVAWFLKHNTHADKICSSNCLDVCVDYNNKWRDLNVM